MPISATARRLRPWAIFSKTLNQPRSPKFGAWELEILWDLEFGGWRFPSNLSASIGFKVVHKL